MLTQTIRLYEERDDVTLTTYVIADSPELLKGGRRPAILICPGGAYLGCSDREGEPVALRFAAMGYHAFVLRYSTYFQGVMTFPQPGATYEKKEHCIHPNPMREIAKSMILINEHAEEWLVDTSRIAITGFSAGAHNCAMYSVYWNQPVIADHFQVPPEMLRPAAAILGYSVCDYLLMKESGSEKTDKELFGLVNLAFLGERLPDDEKLAEISPNMHVNSDTPPMFLWTTAADALVPPENTLRLAIALSLKKIPFEVHVFEEGMHGLSLADQSTAAAMNMIRPDAAQWVPLAERWLNKRFAIPLPEKSAWEP